MMNIYLLRHGETQANVDGIVQGWSDSELNETGRKQVAEAATSFDRSIDAIYSSDLLRTRQTAAIFRDKFPSVPYLEDQRLRERNFGDATGKVAADYDWETFWDALDSTSIPNAETAEAYSARVRSFLDDLRHTDYENVLIVTHGGTINQFQDVILPHHIHTPHDNASITHLEL